MPQETLNRDEVAFHLREAREAIDDLIDEVTAGKLDGAGAMVLRIPFEHIQSHLCAAWHGKWMSQADLGALSGEQFVRMTTSVPDWSTSSRLVDLEADVT